MCGKRCDAGRLNVGCWVMDIWMFSLAFPFSRGTAVGAPPKHAGVRMRTSPQLEARSAWAFSEAGKLVRITAS